MLSPAQFIPLAEALDMIHELGMLVLRQVCDDIGQWLADHEQQTGVPVSVNLSARQLSRAHLAEELIELITLKAIPSDLIRFEVTESLLARQDGPAIRSLQRLRAAGFRVLIDDFGTGYSALSYLHTIPCDVVKLDGSFVSSIADDARLRAIVRRSIELAHDLGMSVVAECIETEEQAAVLRDIACDFGQGYLFSRPVPTEQASRMFHLSERKTS